MVTATSPVTLAAELAKTAACLHHLNALLASCAQTGNPRTRLLATTFVSQLAEVRGVLERIELKAKSSVLARRLLLEKPFVAPTLTNANQDSRALTLSIVNTFNAISVHYAQVLESCSNRAVQIIANELCNLFLAQSRRIAMEANRFEDL